jgi:hypothetical protein
MLKFCNILCSQIQYLETGLLFNGLNPKPYAQAKCKLCYFETFISVHFQWRSLASNSCVNPHFIFVPLPSNIFVRYHTYHSSHNSILLYLLPNSILYFIHSRLCPNLSFRLMHHRPSKLKMVAAQFVKKASQALNSIVSSELKGFFLNFFFVCNLNWDFVM